LTHEDGVCDFLAGLFCSDLNFVAEFDTFGILLKSNASEGVANTENDVDNHQATTSRRVALDV
jgi:hypothetical protein